MEKIPILFLTFNRPELTQAVFNKIKQYQPSQLFIAQDGPRTDQERTLTDQVKNIFIVDWVCDVHFLIRGKNLGCTGAVTQAIDWFFSHVSYGVILEDDCIPSLSFFDFCFVMCARYRTNKRIACISGSNFLGDMTNDTNSYIFTQHSPLLWGWATRKDRWDSQKHWKPNILNDKILKEKGRITRKSIQYYMHIDSRDCSWYRASYTNNLLTIVPTKNLITNTGVMGANAQGASSYHNIPTGNYILNSQLSVPITNNHVYDNAMKKLVRRIYIEKKISSFLKKVGLYTIVKKLLYALSG